MGTTKLQFTENKYKCNGCKKISSESELIGRRDENNYFVLFCDCGSKDIKQN